MQFPYPDRRVNPWTEKCLTQSRKAAKNIVRRVETSGTTKRAFNQGGAKQPAGFDCRCRAKNFFAALREICLSYNDPPFSVFESFGTFVVLSSVVLSSVKPRLGTVLDHLPFHSTRPVPGFFTFSRLSRLSWSTPV
jgi:hypothetical protein